MEDEKIESMRTASGRHRFTKDQILDFLSAGGVDVGQIGDSSQIPSTPPSSPGGFSKNSVVPQGEPAVSPVASPVAGAQEAPVPNPGHQQETPVANNVVADNFSAPVQPQPADVPSSFTEDVMQSPSPVTNEVSDFASSSVEDTPKQDVQSPVAPQTETSSANAHGEFETPQVLNSQSQEQVKEFPQGQTQQQPVEMPVEPAIEEEEVKSVDMPANVRMFKSDYTDLIELARKIKDSSVAKDMEYAFTVYAGLSLHFLIKPFTCLNFYVNPEDLQVWKNELRLTAVQNPSEANVGILINTDIVFVPTREIGGFKVVEDKVLMRDLSDHNEEELVRQFRQHLSTG